MPLIPFASLLVWLGKSLRVFARRSRALGAACWWERAVRVQVGCCLTAAWVVILGGVTRLAWSDEQPEKRADSAEIVDEVILRARGETLYQTQCASCHGQQGEGVREAYAEPLIGDASIGELAALIDETMPEGEADQCRGPDARAVAAYIHYAFYSEAAQVRNRPPRVGLARLTAPQLRQSLADLYAHFGSVPGPTTKQGVRAIYFDGARWKNENKKVERLDPFIDFDFADQGPGNGINPKSFYIYWEGGILAPETGRYEIVVRSTCSFVMDFGKIGRPLINNHVQSGDQTEFRRTLMLTGGRVYPFKIDFIQRERKTEQPPARVSVSWVPPHGVEEVIPTRCLVADGTPATYALQTHLPPDDRSYGFERGIAINREWDESTTAAALDFAQVAASELWPDAKKKFKRGPTPDGSESGADQRAALRAFLTELAETAFRSPLDEASRRLYVDAALAATEDDGEAIKRSLLMCLKSPRFLYPTADREQSLSQRHANRLALTLFDSLPADKWLQQQISENKLQDEKAVRAAARRMVDDHRTRAKMRDMLYEWLNIKHLGDISKDEHLFPGFDSALVSQLRASLTAWLDAVVWSEESDYRQLFLSDWTYTSPGLAEFYGADWQPLAGEGPLQPPLVRSVSAAQRRFGVLSHPYLMSGMSYFNTTSPIHRGVFLIRNVLGRTLRPPNEAFSPISPDLHPDLTTRERVALQTSPESCQICHLKINGLGFALENFDAVGRFRELEKAKPVNALGTYTNRAGEEIEFSGPAELAAYVVSSDDAHRAFVSRLFQHFAKQPIAAYGPQTLDELTERFRSSEFNIRELIIEIAVITATRDSTLAQQDS
jgi:mono/diheme cytochrome c family protein